MTRCVKKRVNLKSSVYNQTGQSYFEQLTAYNSMSTHLRRILLARSVVDARNKNYLKSKQQCKVQRTDSGVHLHLETIDDVINKLAYDTQHHPMDTLTINLNAKHLDCCNCNLDHQLRVCGSQTYYEGTDRMDRRQCSTLKNQRMKSPMTARSPKRKKFLISKFIHKKELKTRDTPYIVDSSTCLSRQRKCRYEKEFSGTDTRFDPSIFKSQSPRQKTVDYQSVSSSVSQCYDFYCDGKCTEEFISKQCSSQKEEKKYVKFIYDITKEIMQRGLYTDKELQEVFKKHINQYKGILNMNKMLYEIYQLKISLNVTDSDTDEELEDLIHAQKLLNLSEIRPPTPPKILDENKVMEKLESYQKMIKPKNCLSDNRKVILVDANPELLVTERDLLISLVEAGVDPKQVQHICKNLRYKSRDDGPTEMAQIDMKTVCSNSKVDNLKLEANDEKVFAETETVENAHDSSVSDNSVESFEEATSSTEQEANSSTLNLVSTQDETTKTKEETKSEIIYDDKVES